MKTQQEILTSERLIELSFIQKSFGETIYFEKNNFILKEELGQWLFCANHNSVIVTTLLVIKTEVELAMLYNWSTNNNLYK